MKKYITTSFLISKELFNRVTRACNTLKKTKTSFFNECIAGSIKELEKQAYNMLQRQDYIAKNGRYSLIKKNEYTESLKGEKDFEKWVSMVNDNITTRPYTLTVLATDKKEYLNPSYAKEKRITSVNDKSKIKKKVVIIEALKEEELRYE